MRACKVVVAVILGVLVQLGVARAQVSNSSPCFGQTAGVTSIQCTANISLGNTTTEIGLSFNTNVCSTINTPPSWTKLGCLAFSTSSAAIFYQTAGAGTASCTAANTPFSCCTGLHTGTCDTPTFTWTGSSTVTGNEITEEGLLAASQLDTSTTNSGTSTTSMTASTLTTATPLEHVLAWYFTDNASSGITFTSPADMGLIKTFNASSYDSFVTEKRQKIVASTGNETGTASASSNYAAFLMAFKPLNPPVGRSFGDVIPINSEVIGAGNPGTPTHSGNLIFSGNANTVDPLCGNTAQGCVVFEGSQLDLVPANGHSTRFWNGTFSNVVATIDNNGFAMLSGFTLQSSGGTAPTLSAGCNGAGSSFDSTSTNNSGQFTTQTAAATTCTIAWSASGTWQNAPHCQFTGGLTAIVPPTSPGTSTYTITFASTGAAVKENYLCM